MIKYVSFRIAMYGLCFVGGCIFIIFFIGEKVRLNDVSSVGYGYE